MYELTEADKKTILEKMKTSFVVISDCEDNMEENKDKGYAYIDVFNPKGYVQCFCKKSNGELQHNRTSCKYCCTRPTALMTENRRKMVDEKRTKNYRNFSAGYPDFAAKTTTFFYVKAMPNNDCGIVIYNLTMSAKALGDAPNGVVLQWKINGVLEVAPGVHCKGYKISRGKEVNMEIAKVLNINTNYTKCSPSVYFEGAQNSIDFILKHKKFNKYTAYMDLFNLIELNLPKDSFFMMYMYLYAEYPSVELVVKMGMYQFCTHLFKKMVHANDSNAIREQVESFTKLLRADATNGTHVFNLPKYVVEDCLQRDASWDEILGWQDIFELDTNNRIGKELYFEATRHPLYNQSWRMFDLVVQGAVYGYTPLEFLNYIQKQHDKAGLRYHYRPVHGQDNLAQTFVDYLRMCDTLNITPDKYPQDVKEVHDNLARAYSAQQNAMMDAIIDEVGVLAEKYIPKSQEYTESDYFIQLPHSSYDIIQEGQNQRNCVGSYLERIAKRETMVFFIRRKEKPQESFITAEYKKGHITQLFYKNNRVVTEAKLRKLANDYAANLRSGHFETRRIA